MALFLNVGPFFYYSFFTISNSNIHMNLLYLKNEGEFRKWLCSVEWLDCSEGQLAPAVFTRQSFLKLPAPFQSSLTTTTKRAGSWTGGKKTAGTGGQGFFWQQILFSLFLLWLNFRVQDLEVLGTTFSFNSLKIYITELHLLILPGLRLMSEVR